MEHRQLCRPNMNDNQDDESSESSAEGYVESQGIRKVLLLDGEPVPASTDGFTDEFVDRLADCVVDRLEVDLDDVEDGTTLGELTFTDVAGHFDPADGLGSDEGGETEGSV